MSFLVAALAAPKTSMAWGTVGLLVYTPRSRASPSMLMARFSMEASSAANTASAASWRLAHAKSNSCVAPSRSLTAFLWAATALVSLASAVLRSTSALSTAFSARRKAALALASQSA